MKVILLKEVEHIVAKEEIARFDITDVSSTTSREYLNQTATETQDDMDLHCLQNFEVRLTSDMSSLFSALSICSANEGRGPCSTICFPRCENGRFI